jgi:hypothetical protein
MVPVTHPHDPADYSAAAYQHPSLSPQGEAAPERASWPLLMIVGALALAIVFLLIRFATHDDTAAVDPGSTAPVTLPPPKHHQANEHDPSGGDVSALPHSRPASGPHWTMQIPRSWTRFSAPNVAEDAAWRTPSRVPGWGGLVIVLHRKPVVPLSLSNFTYGASAALNAGVGAGSINVLRTHVYVRHGEIRYVQRVDGQRLLNLAYIVETKNGFAYLTYAASTRAYKHDVKRIEPYLKTLTGN